MAENLKTIAEVRDEMPNRFNKEAAAGLSATYQFDLTGDGGETFQLKLADGSFEVVDGGGDAANITITMAATDYLDMINGKLNPQMAFMGGKLKIKGDMSLALKMQQLFPNPT
ncbi:MAG: SCP2 sterol-binding domain-containing protein [Deltaproteobacteria bacterium]